MTDTMREDSASRPGPGMVSARGAKLAPVGRETVQDRVYAELRRALIGGTRTDRFGSASRAFSEIRRPSASRTGIVLVASEAARP